MTDNANINTESATVDFDAMRASLVENVNARLAFDESHFGVEIAKKRAKQLKACFVCELTDDEMRVASTRIGDSSLAMLARCGVETFNFIVDHRRETNEFNIYAIQKLANAMRSHTLNHLSEYCRVTLGNLLANRERIEAGKLTLTTEHQHVAFTNTSRENVAKSHVPVRKKTPVADSTASTQYNSTNRALETLGVYRVERGAIVDVDFEHVLFKHVAK